MRVKSLLALAGVCLGLGVTAGTASAQIAPIPVDVLVCDTTRFDFNNDGKLGKSDLMLFWNNVQEANCVDSPAGSEGCGQYDLNGDGIVNFADLNYAYDIFVQCVRPIPTIVQPRQPR